MKLRSAVWEISTRRRILTDGSSLRQIRVSMVLKLTLSIAAASDFVWSNFTAWLMGCTVWDLSFIGELLSEVKSRLCKS